MVWQEHVLVSTKFGCEMKPRTRLFLLYYVIFSLPFFEIENSVTITEYIRDGKIKGKKKREDLEMGHR